MTDPLNTYTIRVDLSKGTAFLREFSGALLHWNSAMYYLCCCINMVAGNSSPIRGSLLKTLLALHDGKKIKKFKTLCEDTPEFSYLLDANILHMAPRSEEEKADKDWCRCDSIFDCLDKGLKARNKLAHIIYKQGRQDRLYSLSFDSTLPYGWEMRPMKSRELNKNGEYIGHSYIFLNRVLARHNHRVISLNAP